MPENENVILVEKKSQTLFLYTSRANEMVVVFQFPCSTGEASGIKFKAGDKKTPEGIYFLKNEYEDKYLSPVYGKKAFPTDYPNFIDKRVGKNGSAIWIHGTNKKLKPMDSNGCIALENADILKLSDYVTLDSTPVIMVQEIDKVKNETIIKQAMNIDSILTQWEISIENGNYHDYLSFYSPEYLPYINWWEQWFKIRKQADKSDLSLGVKRERTGIYYHNRVFVVLFDLFLTAKNGKVQNGKVCLGKRKLFLEYQDNTYKIIGDIFQTVSKKFQKAKVPLITAANTLVTPVFTKESIINTTQQWLAAWSKKDMTKYASFYAENFYSDGMNKKAWVKRKQNLSKKYDYIHVSGREFKVKPGRMTCEISFFQEYKSSRLTTQGVKSLKLVNKGGLWKIYQESWKGK
ncbi:L,D-transpeptidase family protein [Desulfobacula phenolica]|uniref:L,D-transpeptidase family protein n=1 Tax=Desulfobacula phenolica TaxID=90732 RepID=UPI001587F201|nr:L,D-transpeptidase [Desulfobacula phenolica]